MASNISASSGIQYDVAALNPQRGVKRKGEEVSSLENTKRGHIDGKETLGDFTRLDDGNLLQIFSFFTNGGLINLRKVSRKFRSEIGVRVGAINGPLLQMRDLSFSLGLGDLSLMLDKIKSGIRNKWFFPQLLDLNAGSSRSLQTNLALCSLCVINKPDQSHMLPDYQQLCREVPEELATTSSFIAINKSFQLIEEFWKCHELGDQSYLNMIKRVFKEEDFEIIVYFAAECMGEDIQDNEIPETKDFVLDQIRELLFNGNPALGTAIIQADPEPDVTWLQELFTPYFNEGKMDEIDAICGHFSDRSFADQVYLGIANWYVEEGKYQACLDTLKKIEDSEEMDGDVEALEEKASALLALVLPENEG